MALIGGVGNISCYV